MKIREIGLLAAALAGWTVSCCDTARAQSVATFTLNPSPVTFTNIPENSTSSQLVELSSSLSTAVTISSNETWLTIDGVMTIQSLNITANMPVGLQLTVNTQNFFPNQMYAATITVTQNPEPLGGAPQQFFVNLTVTPPSAFYASPVSLSFAAPQGSAQATPSSSNLVINSTGPILNYTLSVTTGSGGNWLFVSPGQGTTGTTAIQVNVNPGNLSPNTYNGLITAQSTTTQDSVSIPVSLTITSGNALSVSPSGPIAFLYSTASPQTPPSQNLYVVSANGPVGFTIVANPPVAWLSVSPSSGTASTALNPISLTPTLAIPSSSGTYTTSLIITEAGGATLAPIPVTLVVSPNPLLSISTTSLNFLAQIGSTTSLTQQVLVTSTGQNLGFSVSLPPNQNWLTASLTTGATPAALNVTVNPTYLPAGPSSGVVTIAPTNGDPYTLQVLVTVNVTSPSSQLFAGSPVAVFAYQTGQAAPPSQNVELSVIGLPVGVSLSIQTSNCGASWLTAAVSSSLVSPSQPAVLTVGITSTAGFNPGICSGNVSVGYSNGIGPQTLNVPVTVNVSNSAELNVGVPEGFGAYTAPFNPQAAQQILGQISLTSTSAVTQVGFSAIAQNTGTAWLFVGSNSQVTPQTLNVIVQPGILQPGLYSGAVTISSPSLAAPVVIPITLTINQNVTVTISPNSLAFTQVQNGAAPAAQTLTVSGSTAGATFSASVNPITGGNWLTVSPASGGIPGKITATVNANQLVAQTYTAQILVSYQNASSPPVTIPVSLTVTSPPPGTTFSVNTQPLTFNYQIGGQTPAPQNINLVGSGGAVSFTASASTTTGGNWLQVSPASGTTPSPNGAAALTVTVLPQNLTNISINSYAGSITISAPGVLATPIIVNVALNVTALVPAITEIKSAATSLPGAIAAGEAIDIYGANLAPASPASGTYWSLPAPLSGMVSTTLNGVKVTFGAALGTPVYVSPTLIEVVVPWEVAGTTSTTLLVSNQNQSSVVIEEAVTP